MDHPQITIKNSNNRNNIIIGKTNIDEGKMMIEHFIIKNKIMISMIIYKLNNKHIIHINLIQKTITHVKNRKAEIMITQKCHNLNLSKRKNRQQMTMIFGGDGIEMSPYQFTQVLLEMSIIWSINIPMSKKILKSRIK